VGYNLWGSLGLSLGISKSCQVNERLQEPFDHSTESEAKREKALETPLHRAVKKTKLARRWFLAHGADSSIKDCLGRTAFD